MPVFAPRLDEIEVSVSRLGEQFVTPSHVNAKDTKYCPLETPFVQPGASSTSAYSAPAMYRTDAMNYGSDKPVTLSG